MCSSHSRDEPKQSLYWNFASFLISHSLRLTNPNNRCIETLLFYIHNYPLLRRTQTIVVLKLCDILPRLFNISDEPKQSLYWNPLIISARATLFCDEPKQSLYWNRRLGSPGRRYFYGRTQTIVVLKHTFICRTLFCIYRRTQTIVVLKQAILHLTTVCLIDEPKQSLYWNVK